MGSDVSVDISPTFRVTFQEVVFWLTRRSLTTRAMGSLASTIALRASVIVFSTVTSSTTA